MSRMKWIKRIVRAAAGIFIFCMIADWLNYIYVQAETASEGRILWHSFYEDQGKIDNLYLGSSHVYCDINPFQLDELNGQYNFSLSSSGQMMNGTYYLLREADKKNCLSHVYIELYYMNNVKSSFANEAAMIRENNYRNWINTDYMKMSFNKLAYMYSVADISGVETWVPMCFPFTRYCKTMDSWETIKKTIADKKTDDYKNFIFRKEYENGYAEYRKKGFRFSTKVYMDKERKYKQTTILKEDSMSDISESYLQKTIEYCLERNIPVTLFVSPIYELQLISTENYDNYFNQIKEIAEEYHIPFYDFNLAKKEYLSIQNTEYFRDISHLNSKGADIYTAFFHEVMSGEEGENADRFYDSYKQKLQNAEPEVYGIYYREQEESTEGEPQLLNMWIASNRAEDMEYRIILTPNEKEQYMVQDFDENKMFTVDSKEHGICTIVYRIKDTQEVQTIEIDY